MYNSLQFPGRVVLMGTTTTIHCCLLPFFAKNDDDTNIYVGRLNGLNMFRIAMERNLMLNDSFV